MMKRTTKQIVVSFLSAFVVFAFLPLCGLAGAIPDGIHVSPVYAPGAGAPIGKVRWVYGKALLMHSGGNTAYQVRKEMALYQGDALSTDAECRMALILNDESVITLGPKTEMVLDKSVFDPDSGSRTVLLNMLVGKARFFVKKFAMFKNSMFRVKTKTSVAAVRGSDFIIEQVGDKTVITTLGMTVLEVSNPQYPLAEPVVVNSFQQLMVAINQLPGNPINVSEYQIRQILADLNIPVQGGEGGQGAGGQGAGGQQGQGSPLDNFNLPNQPPSVPEPTQPSSPYAP